MENYAKINPFLYGALSTAKNRKKKLSHSKEVSSESSTYYDNRGE